ncbi:Ig-like domain-containing protein [Bradyrhizobium stylosanthis]|uniref:Ig-like domain-containing protein n=2 Tax=Bradyrhizobium stylosanthis TaxID=1803665 RepID=A0A560ECK9_9BRAD|nr:Ig-like domain-containing protein [Bradyrhizobium stylosanthis]
MFVRSDLVRSALESRASTPGRRRPAIRGPLMSCRLLQMAALILMLLAAPATAFAVTSLTPPSGSLSPGTVGDAYTSTQFSGAGGTAGCCTYAASGAVPPGLTLSPSGLLSGTPTAAGSFSFTVTATDTDTSSVSNNYTLVINKAATTVSVTSSANPGPYGSFTFTAVVSSTPGAGTPTGTVIFSISGAGGAVRALIGGIASFTTGLDPGSYTVSATYSGDGNFDSSFASLNTSQIVTPANTTTAVTSSANPSVFGQSVTFTATVSSGAAVGISIMTADFLDGGTSINAGPFPNAGTLTTSLLAVGNHTITASYAGDSFYYGSTGPLTGNPQVVNKANTTTSVTSSVNPSAVGQSVSFTAVVAAVAPGAGTPTGTVTFLDGGSPIGSAPLSGGSVTFTTPALAAGSHTITVSYGGDGNFNGSTGSLSGNPQVVNAPLSPPVIDATFAPSSIPVNGTTTLTFTITNPSASTALTGAAFSDTLPPGLVITAANALTTTCGGVFTAAAGSGPITLSGGTVAAGSSCTASLNVTATSVGAKTNTSGPVSSTNGGTGNTASAVVTVTTSTTTTGLTSSLNPSGLGQSVTFTATVTTPSGTPTGTVTFKDGPTTLGTGVLAGGVATFTTAALSAGSHSITAVYAGDANNAGSASAALTQAVNQSATTTVVTSSQNPSAAGQPVTFSATVSSGGGTPTGTVTFSDGGAVIGTATLAAGVATFTAGSLTLGSHTITASYAGNATYTASTSAPLIQSVNTPADSLKLRAMQTLAAPVAAQFSGQAISGVVDSAIGEGFSDGGPLVMLNSSGVRFNFAADPDAATTDPAPRGAGNDPAQSRDRASALGMRPASPSQMPGSRVDDAFAAINDAAAAKAPPRRIAEPRDWLAWAEVRGATLDRWSVAPLGSATTVPMLYGNQVNALAGVTRKLTPNLLVGVLGGYETFDYHSDVLTGRLKGDGWTLGSYLGWRVTDTVRFDAGIAYSGIGYNATAGTAAGSFTGSRWLASGGLTGTYRYLGLLIEPSAKVYAMWEHESAYTDTLGTLQAARDFTSGRASGGVKLAYPVAWLSRATVTPYVGLYGDYYFNGDTAAASALAAAATPPAFLLDGWSARATGGFAARYDNGAQIAVGVERGGIGGDVGLWTYRARASIPFSAQ